MARTSLSEDSLVRFEQYLNSNPYREYSMSKPYFPRTSHISTHSNRLIPQQQSSTLAFHALLDNSKNSLTLDRIAYKLRMKSDLNIDTLRETDKRRRRRQQHHPQNHLNLEVSDVTSSTLPLNSTKTFRRQPASTIVSTDVTKILISDDLNGIEGSAVRVGAIDELIKRFRRTEHQLLRGPTDYLESPSSCVSSNASRHDRSRPIKSQQQQPHHQERLAKQTQALTEYRFKAPTFPSISTRTHREPSNYQLRTRDQHYSKPELTSLHPCPLNSPEQHRQRLNSLTNQDQQQQQPIEMNPYDKRIQESREKSLMRTEKQLCVFNKLTIVDPFNGNSDQIESSTYHSQQSQQQPPPPPTTNYIFPPIRPFGYFTKKSTTTDDVQQSPRSVSLSPRMKKKHGTKKMPSKVSKITSNILDRNDNIQMFNARMKTSDSLSDIDDGIHNTTVDVDLNVAGTLMQNTDDDDEVDYL